MSKNNLMIRICLAFSAGFNCISSIIWICLKDYEKSINRVDMAIIFIALYFILEKLNEKKL